MNGPRSSLGDLQRRVLEVLAPIDPPWTLMGGAALAGFHLDHRTTLDLDLFWWERGELGRVTDAATHLLEEAGLDVGVLQETPAFLRLRAADGGETVVIDLIADPATCVDEAGEAKVGGARIRVASLHAILVHKLCALLGRAEIRDLQDVHALLDRDCDLGLALENAGSVDTGFSPLTLAWILREFQVAPLAEAAGIDAEDAAALDRFREELAEDLLRRAQSDEK